MSLFKSATAPAPAAEPAKTAAPATPAAAPAPAMPAPRADIPARPAMPGAAPVTAKPATSVRNEDNARRLVVGLGISLTGEVASCDMLVVEGTIQAKLTGARLVEVSTTGTFKGSAEIEEACIAGRFEGELTVKGLLKVQATGMVQGTVRCGALEVERGGRISGNMSFIDEAAKPALARVV